MNSLVVVIDSLSFSAAPHCFDEIASYATEFTRAYSADCWTLPSHASMFTGELPSTHGAHFQSMAMRRDVPTLASVLGSAGFETELISRNPVFDGSIPGLCRGFEQTTRFLAQRGKGKLSAVALALTKPRLQRQIRETGFFHPKQADNARFVREFARLMFPADDEALDYCIERMQSLREKRRPYFMFVNLFDVHAPYCPSPASLFREVHGPADLVENVVSLGALAKVGRHAYLRDGFRISERARTALLARYESAVELASERVGRFIDSARAKNLLEDTLLIVTSDHGEAFGEHDLFFHDASAYETHLRVPLWVRHPDVPPGSCDDVVSLRSLFGLIQRSCLEGTTRGTLLDPEYRQDHAVAIAEHFYYPHLPDAMPRYLTNLVSAIGRRGKVIVRNGGAEHYDLGSDPDEQSPEGIDFRDLGGELAPAVGHLEEFRSRFQKAA